MGDAPEEIKIRHIENCMKADPAYGEGVVNALGISMSAFPAGGSALRHCFACRGVSPRRCA
jgi:hypothetical protein